VLKLWKLHLQAAEGSAVRASVLVVLPALQPPALLLPLP
jgi:hypothetical protein